MFNDYTVMKLKLNKGNSPKHAREFIKRYHYLKSVARGCKYMFALMYQGRLMGVAQYGEPVGAYVKNKYGKRLVELKRFCLHPDCVKNTGSWFLARCYKELPKNIKVISYADPRQGHEGTLYKASNFKAMGPQRYATPHVKIKGDPKLYSARIMYQKLNGKLTNSAKIMQKLQKQKKASIVYTPKKLVFLYEPRK